MLKGSPVGQELLPKAGATAVAYLNVSPENSCITNLHVCLPIGKNVSSWWLPGVRNGA
jgi:hypothetical protein